MLKLLFHRSDKLKNRSRMKRNSSTISAYCGLNGAGKTLTMVRDSLPYLEMGMSILSSVRILDYKNPRPCDDKDCNYPSHPNHKAAHPNWIPLTNYNQILMAKDCVILLDEIQGILSSRDYSTLPTPILNKLMQFRRDNCVIKYSCPFFGRADKVLREVTQTVNLCVPYISKTKKSEPGKPPILWKERFFIFVRTYSAELIDEFDARGADLGNVRPKVFELFYRPWSVAQLAYDTYDMVLSIGANELGQCLTCGGKRQAQRCSCPDNKHYHQKQKAKPVSDEDDYLDPPAPKDFRYM